MPEPPYKYVTDPVHNRIGLSKLQAELLAQPELQRLSEIAQLSFARKTYPGATNTRLSHSIGTSYVGRRVADSLGLSAHNCRLLEIAGLLHDIGHGPGSHAVDKIMPVDHMELTYKLITGESRLPLPKDIASGKIPEILEAHELPPKSVGELVRPCEEPTMLQSLIHGAVDVDQLDYIPRDSYFTGAKHTIGLDMIIQSLVVHKGELAIQEKGIAELEQFFSARYHMYGVVYVHHTGRSANGMLQKALQDAKARGKLPEDFYAWTDGELLTRLKDMGEYPAEIANRLVYRQFFKRAYTLKSYDLSSYRLKLKDLQKRGEQNLESEIAKEAGIDRKYVLVDFPAKVLETSEPRMHKVRFNVLTDDGRLMDITDISPLVKTILSTETSRLVFGVYTPEEHRAKVRKVIEGMLT
jgi:HD superfamily phosphohydrolase